MAILRGFPPSNTISPSVRITEKDLSYIAAAASFHAAGLVGFCSKGPINQPTSVATSQGLHTTFGYPHPDVSDPYLIYAAEQYLLIANELWIVRVANTDATSDEQASIATIEVPVSGEKVIFQSQLAGPFTFSADMYFRWKINDVLSSKTLMVAAGTYTLDELVAELNDQLDSIDADGNITTNGFDGIVFTDGSDLSGYEVLTLESTWAYGPNASIELVSVLDSMYGGISSVTGLGLNMTQAVATGSLTKWPSSGTTGQYDLSDVVSPFLQIVIDGTGAQSMDNVVQTITLTQQLYTSIGDIVDEINAQVAAGTIPGGFVASAYGNSLVFTTDTFGSDAKLLIKKTGVYARFGFDGATAMGTSPESYTNSGVTDAAAKVLGVSITLNAPTCFTVNADSNGIEGNNTKVVVTNNTSENTFSIDVYNNGVQVESWGSLTKDQTSTYYVETYIALVSSFISVVDNTDEPGTPQENTTSEPYYQLIGGSDGIPSSPDDQDALLSGSDLGFTGLYAFSEPEQIDIDLLAVPGHSSTEIVLKLIDVCQNYRMDCLAIIDPPFGLTVKEIVQWQNGTHPYNTIRFDSDFAALYWPWVQIRDSFNQINVWVPPSGSVMATYAFSDNLAQPWFAPAGLTRGIVPGITDVFSRPTLEERDSMYGNRNAINPIIQFSDATGYVIWGQKTLQRTPTALDRVNVRRLMFVIEKRIRAAARSLLFEPHDQILEREFTAISTGILNEIKIGRGLNDFIVQCDSTLNTPDVIDRNELRARIGIQPIRAAEFIFIEFSIHRTGSFTEPANTF